MPKTKEPFHDPLAKLAKVIEDYYDGIKLIDREFDNACEQIDQSIANTRGESTKRDRYSKSEMSQERKLRQQSEKLTKLTKELRLLTRLFKKLNKAKQVLKKKYKIVGL